MKDERTLVGGAYRCDDCGHIVDVTTLDRVWALAARRITDEVFIAACPCCYPYFTDDLKRVDRSTWNTFRRLGFWQTLKHVWHDMVANAKGY